jgi:hypothetical protein
MAFLPPGEGKARGARSRQRMRPPNDLGVVSLGWNARLYQDVILPRRNIWRNHNAWCVGGALFPCISEFAITTGVPIQLTMDDRAPAMQGEHSRDLLPHIRLCGAPVFALSSVRALYTAWRRNGHITRVA